MDMRRFKGIRYEGKRILTNPHVPLYFITFLQGLKNVFPLILFSFLSLFTNAQVSDQTFQPENCKAVAGIDAGYEMVSSSINSNFLNTFLFGNRIDSLSKQRMFEGLNQDNRLGADIEGGLSYITFPDTFMHNANMGLFVKYNRYYHMDMAFTDDLARLFFDGNKHFAGKTANIDNSILNIISYDQVQFGILSKFDVKNFKQTFGVGISLNNGYRNTIINVTKGSLFTQANAEYLNFAANYEVSRSDTAHKKLNMFKGYGMSLNLYYSIEAENKNSLVIQLTDMGYIRWNKHSQQFSKDTAVHFEGVQVSDLLNIEGNIFGQANTDSIAQTYTYADTTLPYYTYTPAVLNISYLYNISEKGRFEFSFRKKFFSNYDPMVMMKMQYFPCKKTMLSLDLSYGGYSSASLLDNHRINAGLEYMHQFGKSLVLLAGTNYLNGFIAPKTLAAQGVYFSIKKYFF